MLGAWGVLGGCFGALEHNDTDWQTDKQTFEFLGLLSETIFLGGNSIIGGVWRAWFAIYNKILWSHHSPCIKYSYRWFFPKMEKNDYWSLTLNKRPGQSKGKPQAVKEIFLASYLIEEQLLFCSPLLTHWDRAVNISCLGCAEAGVVVMFVMLSLQSQWPHSPWPDMCIPAPSTERHKT